MYEFWHSLSVSGSHRAAIKVLRRVVYLSEGSTGESSRSKLTHMVVGRFQFLAGCWPCGH